MRVLVVHNYRRRPGGEDVSVDQEISLLRSFGHTVSVYSRSNEEVSPVSTPARTKAAASSLWSFTSNRSSRELIETCQPEVAYCMNTFPLISHSIYRVLDEYRLPVIQGLRTYRSFCVNALLYREGRICTECVSRTLAWPGVWYGCHQEGRAASAVAAISAWLERASALRTVKYFVVPSETARRQFIHAGFPSEKMVVKPDVVFPDLGCGSGDGEFALFAGRLSPEKGLKTLLQAWGEIDFPLVIVGEGPLRGYVEEALKRYKGRIEYAGPLPNQELLHLMGAATCLVSPSECLETFGRVVLESASRGTPSIVARQAAAAELIQDGHNGLYFDSGRPESLKDRAEFFLKRCDRSSMRKHAREMYTGDHLPQASCSRLIEIFQRAAN